MNFVIIGARARDKVNGNTYHAAKCIVDGKLVTTASRRQLKEWVTT